MPKTIHDVFAQTRARYPAKPFICVPASDTRDWLRAGGEFAYREVAERVERLRRAFAAAGYGHGHRVLVSLENRHEHFEYFLALNALGVSIVPGNPDYRHDELVYHLSHSESDLVIAAPRLRETLHAAAIEVSFGGQPVPVIELGEALPAARRPPPVGGVPQESSEAILLYTSGSTGRPKGSITSNRFAYVMAEWFLSWGALMTIRDGEERGYSPLPFYHLSGGLHTPLWAMMSGGCFILADRFSPRRFWSELAATRATVATFLGIMPPLLLAQPETPDERRHCCRIGIAAGLPQKTREDFEARFGILMLDGWGMTELARNIGNYLEPRDLSTSAMGRPREGMDVRVVDDAGNDVPRGETGELVVRASGPDPHDGFSDGYLKDPEATALAWRGGWFHTGDSVRQGPDGMLYFVDRRKNIIRRSGENIAAGEVEQALASHPQVALCTVLAVPDEMRQEEVLACVVPKAGAAADPSLAESIVEHALSRLAYYKAPGWVRFVTDLPTTASQKVQKFRLFAEGEDPLAGAIDLRALKQRRKD